MQSFFNLLKCNYCSIQAHSQLIISWAWTKLAPAGLSIKGCRQTAACSTFLKRKCITVTQATLYTKKVKSEI